MIRTVIIEDEKLIAGELKKKLTTLSSEVEVVATLETVKDSIAYFEAGHPADLIFSDIQLPDGLSFDIFSTIHSEAPLVFVTAYDQYVIEAFDHNGIDYLLKPVDDPDLVKVLEKYKSFEKHFTNRRQLMSRLQKRKERLIVKKGTANMILRLGDVVLFYTENKMVFVLDREGRKFVCEQNLAELESMLDEHLFFRANRQYIIHAAFIRGYKSFEKVKLMIDMELPGIDHQVIVSQESAQEFRHWISQL
jgi:DNA-binding LytR/AlgR family response regulator